MQKYRHGLLSAVKKKHRYRPKKKLIGRSLNKTENILIL